MLHSQNPPNRETQISRHLAVQIQTEILVIFEFVPRNWVFRFGGFRGCSIVSGFYIVQMQSERHTSVQKIPPSVIQHSVTRFIDMCDCDMSHSYVWHDSFICVTWFIHMCDMTHSYVWHDSFIRATWLIYKRDMIHSYMWNDLFALMIWLFLTQLYSFIFKIKKIVFVQTRGGRAYSCS